MWMHVSDLGAMLSWSQCQHWSHKFILYLSEFLLPVYFHLFLIFLEEHIISSVSVSLKFIAPFATWPLYFIVGLQKLLLLHNWNWNFKYHIFTSLTTPKAGTLPLATVCSKLLGVYCFRIHINTKPSPLYFRRTHTFY